MKFLCFALIFFLCPLITGAEELKTFTTDGCSSFPDGTGEHVSLWVNCCIRHDLAYWKGGSKGQRLQADKSLESCVAKVGEPEIAKLMLAGVRVGGSPYFPTRYRWAYGWPFPRGYKELSLEEKEEVKRKLDLFKVVINSLVEEFENN